MKINIKDFQVIEDQDVELKNVLLPCTPDHLPLKSLKISYPKLDAQLYINSMTVSFFVL
jgi:hypothetical protein